MMELMKNRVGELDVARVLHLIGATPNRREKPLPSDTDGDYDFWFDGGAASVETGYINYYLDEGTRVWVAAPVPVLGMEIKFADGRVIVVQQETKARHIWP